MNKNEKEVVILNEIHLPAEKLKDLIRKIWGRVTAGGIKTPVPVPSPGAVPPSPSPDLFHQKGRRISRAKQGELPMDIPVSTSPEKKAAAISTRSAKQKRKIQNNYTDPYKWTEDNYEPTQKISYYNLVNFGIKMPHMKKSELISRYIGPDLTKYFNFFSKLAFTANTGVALRDIFKPGATIKPWSNDFIKNREKYMRIWNAGMKRKIRAGN